MSKNHQDSLLKTIVLTESLINTLDELEKEGFYRKALKMRGKQFKSELEKYSQQVFDKVKKSAADNQEKYDAGQYAFELSRRIDELFNT